MTPCFREHQEAIEAKTLSPLAKKSKNSTRWKPENHDPYRTEYQRDVGRILYSDPFRRLRLKTQVFSASNLNQHNRTRLTHSLEVSQIARSIARPLLLNMDLTEAIALGHDLGHTPFGHAGERALNNCLNRYNKKFSHNAQSVWVIQKLMYHRKDVENNPLPGLNLTYDTSEGIWKHTKVGEPEYEFRELNKLHPESPSPLEGQIVDKADGIAYLKHDIDDAKCNGLIKESDIKEIWDNNADIPFDKNWINYLIYDLIIKSKESNQITFSQDIEKLYKDLKAFTFDRIIKSDQVKKNDDKGEEIITYLFNYYMNNVELIVRKSPRPNTYKLDKFGPERVVTDYIQWLGDEMTEREYKKIINK